VRLKTLFIKENMTGYSPSFHETLLLVVILYCVEMRELEAVRYVNVVKRIKAKLIIFNFVKLKARPYTTTIRMTHRLANRIKDRASAKRGCRSKGCVSPPHLDYTGNLCSNCTNKAKPPQAESFSSAAQENANSTATSPSSPKSLTYNSVPGVKDLGKLRAELAKAQEVGLDGSSSKGGLLRSRLVARGSHALNVDVTDDPSGLDYEMVEVRQKIFGFGAALPTRAEVAVPSECVCKSFFSAEIVCAVSQNERWIPLLGWSPYALIPSDPEVFSTTDCKFKVNLNVDVPREGPYSDLWAPPKGFVWIPGWSWKLQDGSDSGRDSNGCKSHLSKLMFF
jgi:hypothetical protein